MIKYYKILTILFLAVLPPASDGQTRVSEDLQLGKQLFWQARFDSARTVLNRMLTVKTPTSDEVISQLHEANLYLGFIAIRQSRKDSLISSYFESAIKLQPQKRVDDTLFPPEFVEPFEKLYKQMVNCIYLESDPIDTDVFGFQGDSVLFHVTTPVELCQLSQAPSDLLFSREGYESEFVTFETFSQGTDTFRVKLQATNISAKRGGNGWKWLVIGGAVAATSAVLIVTQNGDQAPETPAPTLLPTPPVRPEP